MIHLPLYSYEESDMIDAIESKVGYAINDPHATNIPLVTFWNNWKKIRIKNLFWPIKAY